MHGLECSGGVYGELVHYTSISFHDVCVIGVGYFDSMASAFPSKVELPLVYPTDLDDSIFGDDSCTVLVSVLRCEHLAAGRMFLNTSSPYIELKIHPPDSVFGNQLQRTSYKPSTVDPEWHPFESFQFTTTNMSSREIRLYA